LQGLEKEGQHLPAEPEDHCSQTCKRSSSEYGAIEEFRTKAARSYIVMLMGRRLAYPQQYSHACDGVPRMSSGTARPNSAGVDALKREVIGSSAKLFVAERPMYSKGYRRYRWYSEGSSRPEAVPSGTGPAVPPCHTSGNTCIAVGPWRYHRYPLSHLKRRES
jgi:hypothetical protein